MRQLWRFVRVAWTMLVHTLYTAVAVRRRPPERRAAFRAHRQHVGCRRLCEILGVRVTVEGDLPGHDGMLVVCNHFGVLDPLVLASRLPVAFVGKAGIRQWPFVGWVCATMGVIFVERERRSATASFVEQVRARMADGVDVLVFPEGTTTRGRTVRPFKTGAFAAVAGTDGRVLPLFLDARTVEGRPAVGAERERVVWAEGSPSFLVHFWHLLGLRRVHMVLRVGPPVSADGHDRKALARALHACVHRLAAHEVALER